MTVILRSEDGDSGDEDRMWWRARVRPDNEIPVCVPVNLTLGSSADVAAYIAGMTVFSNGVQFTLEVIARPGFRLGDGSAVADAFDDGTDLLLGIEYADGRRHTNLGAPPSDGSAAEAITLMEGGGSGADNSASSEFFLAPLPPPDEFSVHFAWEAAGIAETKTLVPTAAVLEAAGQVHELWPWAEPDEDGESEFPSMKLPKGGWFAQIFRRDGSS